MRQHIILNYRHFNLTLTRVVFELLTIAFKTACAPDLTLTRVVFESVTRGENIDAVVNLTLTRVVFE